MITESVVLPVRAGYEPAFERAFRSAQRIIARQHGYLSHSLRRGVEDPSTYLLTVEWETLEDHEVGFRGSADYQEWRALLHPFYEPVPTVLHYGDDLAGEGAAWLDEARDADAAAVAAFWARCREEMPALPEHEPEAWCFGVTAGTADGLLELVLAGVKTGTASSLRDYEDQGEEVPAAGALSIVLDGSGRPRALVETTAVDVVPFTEVTAEHAASEGEGDRSLAYWRAVHEDFWRTYSPQGFRSDMPVVCERFRLVRAETDPRP